MPRKPKSSAEPQTDNTAEKQTPAVIDERRVAAWASAEAAVEATPVRPKLKLDGKNEDGALRTTFASSGEAALLQQTIGTRSVAFANLVVRQLLNLSADGSMPTDDDINAALAFVAAVAPRNEVEALMAVQMFGAQRASYDAMIRSNSATMLEKRQAYANMGNKWARTFAALTDSLVKLRNGGAQIVKHIQVAEGGQAVIADTVHTGGRG